MSFYLSNLSTRKNQSFATLPKDKLDTSSLRKKPDPQKMGNPLKILLVLSLSICLISNIGGEKIKIEKDVDIPENLGNLLHEPLKQFYELRKSSPRERKNQFISHLNDFKCHFDQTCGIWERDVYQVSIDCRLIDPCAIADQAFEIVEELYQNHDNLNEVTSALGNMIRPETFIKLAEVLFGLPELSNNKVLPTFIGINLEEWKLEKNPIDSKLQANVKEVFYKFLEFQQNYGKCLHLEDSEEFMFNHKEYIEKIDYAQYKRMMDSADDLENIASIMKDILMDIAIVLSAEKAQ